jgi:hypothetical protein
MQASQIMTFLTTAKFTKVGFNGTSTDFLDLWLDKYRVHTSIVVAASRINEAVALSLLKAAFSQQAEFHAIEMRDNERITLGDPGFNYNQYVSQLTATCATFDVSNYPSSKISKTLVDPAKERKVSMHDLMYGGMDDDDEVGYDGSMTLDDPIDGYLVHATNRRRSRFPRRPSLNREVWGKISKEDQETWDKLNLKPRH